MEHFSIVHTICRLSMANSSEALKHQVERLAQALQADGAEKDAQSLKTLMLRAGRAQEMVPRRLVPSRASVSLPGETLIPTTALPADRESGVRLVEAVFPDASVLQRPFLPPQLDRAVQMLLDEWKSAAELRAIDTEPSMSVLLTGAPGTGKTTLALWMSAQIGLPVVIARVDAMMSSFLGTTSRNIAQVFSFANRFRCVLLLDELDSLAKVRDDPNEVGEIKRVVNALLQNMDSRSTVGVTLGITNHPQLLDPAVWRRFAVQVEIPMPVLEAREAIVRRVAAPVEMSDSLVALIAALLDGSAGSEVRSIVTLFKKRTVMQPPPASPVDALREIASLNSGRLSTEVKAILRKDDPDVARWIRKTLGNRINLHDLGALFDKSKSTVARWLEEQETRV